MNELAKKSSRRHTTFKLGSGKYHSNVFSKMRPRLTTSISLEDAPLAKGYASDEAGSDGKSPTNK